MADGESFILGNIGIGPPFNDNTALSQTSLNRTGSVVDTNGVSAGAKIPH
jgi:hypothetical protein